MATANGDGDGDGYGKIFIWEKKGDQKMERYLLSSLKIFKSNENNYRYFYVPQLHISQTPFV